LTTALLFKFCCWGRVSTTLLGLALNSWSSCFHLWSSWDYRCALLCQAFIYNVRALSDIYIYIYFSFMYSFFQFFCRRVFLSVRSCIGKIKLFLFCSNIQAEIFFSWRGGIRGDKGRKNQKENWLLLSAYYILDALLALPNNLHNSPYESAFSSYLKIQIFRQRMISGKDQRSEFQWPRWIHMSAWL
jgi:hypothetical protein